VAERNGRRLAVTLLGAEHQPIRAWQQGATLLDWGFSVSPDARVGRLVNPGETQATAAKPGKAAGAAARAAGAEANATGSRKVPSWSPAALGTATLVLIALPAVALLAWWRRRARRS
jgi:D-alanyl-D-alanine carboxypeptidase (penicillin-binding protein 5/6)